MGFHGISIGSLLVIFLIAVLLFGTKRLREMAEDLGVAIRNFNKALRSEDISVSKKPKNESFSNDSN